MQNNFPEVYYHYQSGYLGTGNYFSPIVLEVNRTYVFNGIVRMEMRGVKITEPDWRDVILKKIKDRRAGQ
jgi:hypothetical protein